MSSTTPDRLAKIIALLTEGSNGERLAALDRLQAILASNGQNLSDALLHALNSQAMPPEKPETANKARDEAAYWRRIAEQHAAERAKEHARQQAALRNWQDIARNAANQLWEIGRAISEDADLQNKSRNGDANDASASVIAFNKHYRQKQS